mmetsp:Transcript_3851/g.7685  ORF Transcript_3851/g.7685 Transcript_3851/m.7685 type:complete len:555 (-) Transcript_3851:98-1762(-)|eukprot:CAMPEP_0172903364 /NCGR_PEP_ID=MMETSP1075-20121228/170380_1 /TAXON_ID=2916 /ORGANISM="Ceratium fusus, Strain PA161109" /LENGTH=554 /DNA_ID=CAMNT_0013760153 /DNA_START=81 /DNA_END=1745 /DNA_ORIENTATION=+
MGAEQSAPRFNAAEFAGTFRGSLTDKYEILQQLGAGAQGAAYLVKMREGGDEYVAKETHDMSAEGKEEFKEEFAKMADMRHPNCTRVIELIENKELMDGEWKDQLFLIAELARGSDLYKYMRKATGANVILTEEWVAGVYKQAMQGVAYIHSKGIVHNDLKPDNILMLDAFDPSDPNKIPNVVINDFGCATLASDKFFKCGDLRYQSPESWFCIRTIMDGGDMSGFKKLDAKADVWSMGATLFELLSGGLIPFIYKSCTMHDLAGDPELMIQLSDAIMDSDFKIGAHCPDISPEAEELLCQVFQKDLSDRPSAEEVLKHPWFEIKGKPMSDVIQYKLEFKETKGVAHTILLNAMALKLQRDHYQQCWGVFDAADKDKSGMIGLAEFTECCEKIGRDPDDAERLFKQADIDGNGHLDFNEFMAMTFDWQSLDPKALNSNVHKLINDLDASGTGNVSESELSTIFQGMLSQKELHDVFKRIDEDGNGSISVKEMEAFLFEPANEDDLQHYAERRHTEAELDVGGKEDHSEAKYVLGVGVPACICLCMAWHGIVKFF